MKTTTELDKKIKILVNEYKSLIKQNKYTDTAFVRFDGQEINVPISYSLIWESDMFPTIKLSTQKYSIFNIEVLIKDGKTFAAFKQRIKDLVSNAEKLSIEENLDKDYIWDNYLGGR